MQSYGGADANGSHKCTTAPGAWLSSSSRLDVKTASLLDVLWANKWLIDCDQFNALYSRLLFISLHSTGGRLATIPCEKSQKSTVMCQQWWLYNVQGQSIAAVHIYQLVLQWRPFHRPVYFTDLRFACLPTSHLQEISQDFLFSLSFQSMNQPNDCVKCPCSGLGCLRYYNFVTLNVPFLCCF